jgi:catechol 2,3-dioxygenase-like lactoylglutathione lyase family enzyme
MDFASIRVITDDVRRLVTFYEQITGTAAQWGSEQFAQLVTPVGTLAIASTATMDRFGAGAAHGADNRSVLIEFRVADVDGEAGKLRGLGVELVLEPTTQPWGNRSVLFRDPDGNLVNFFTPVPAAGPRP